MRLTRLVAALLLLLVTATGLVWLLLWLAPPGPAVLLIAGAGYEDNLAIPHNAPGREAMGRLGQLAGKSEPLSRLFRRSGKLRLANPPLEVRKGTDWARRLDGAAEQTVIVYLALHGGADGKGAYLLPHDAGADPDDRIRLEAVLDRLAELPPGKNKLLVLDATGLASVWSLGLLHNDFARALAALESRIEAIPNLVVISASDVDQRSWPAADGRTSLFARHFLRGLAGDADSDGNGRLDAWELFEHVRRNVTDDARWQRAVTQSPVLLPSGAGPRRARAIPLTFRLDPAPDDDPPPSAEAEVQAAWQNFHRFAARRPAAVAAAPESWRLWQAWLLRHESLRRAGAAPAAAVALQRAHEAEERVTAALGLALPVASATLAMPALAGETDLDTPEPFPALDRLWGQRGSDPGAAWQSLLRGANSPAALRRQLQQGLVQRAAVNPARDLADAARLLRLIDDPLRSTRPAEAHFLVLLDRDLAERPVPDDLSGPLRRALRLRLSAERTALAAGGRGYASAERVYPWIRAAVEDGDRARQHGQDLLFTTSRDDWRRAGQLLDQAEARYTEAAADAAIVRQAWSACDRALAELPWHAHWLAGIRVTDAPLTARARQTFDDVRRLEGLLADVPPRRDPDRLRRLAELGGSAEKTLAALAEGLGQYASRCEAMSADMVCDAEVILEVPMLDPARRWQLLRGLERLPRRARADGAAPVTPSPQAEADGVRQRARLQGLLALAALGQRWFDRFGGDRDTFEMVERDLRQFPTGARWWEVTTAAGDQVGQRMRQYPGEVSRLVRSARHGDEPAARDLPPAARLARRFDPGQCQTDDARASELTRRARLQALLVRQADRTWRDHWYGDDPNGPRYFQVVGDELLAAARRLDLFARPTAPGEDAVRARLARVDALRIDAPAARSLVAGERPTLSARMQTAPGDELAGAPLLWAQPVGPLTLPRMGDLRRVVQEVGAGAKAEPLPVQVASPELDKAEQSPPDEVVRRDAGLAWRGYWRGRKLEQTTAVHLYPTADSVQVGTARPAAAAVAVRADPRLLEQYGVARGALAVVVDCSGSMGPATGQAMTEQTRYRVVLRALRAVLARVPRGTSVSVWVFGQAVPPGMTVANPEETVRRVQEPLTWDRSPRQLDGVLGKVEPLTPWNRSPIVHAMIRAREDLMRADGFRTLVVLTDGVDNCFTDDRQLNPDKAPISEALRGRFRGTGIAVHVVGFQVQDKEEEEYRKQFEVVKSLSPAGSVTTIDHLEGLIRRLDEVMRPRLRFRLAGDGRRSAEVDVGATGDSDDHWLTAPAPPGGGTYRLEVTAGWPFERPVVLRGGEALRLRLYAAGQRPAAERLLWSMEPGLARRPAVQMGDWRAALLQNQLLGGKALQQLLAVEKAGNGDGILRQVRPGGLWLEATPTGVAAPRTAVRWGEVPGYPAPTWGVDVPVWPTSGGGPAAPRVRVWWGPEREVSGRALRRPGDFRVLADLAGTHAVSGEQVQLDGVTLEERWVQTAAGLRERRWCVVVRATHAPGRPVRTRLEGLLGLAGQEHRHYLAAGRYVGLFWLAGAPTREQMQERLDSDLAAVVLVSINALKREAAERGTFADFSDPGMPGPTPPRPRAVVGTAGGGG